MKAIVPLSGGLDSLTVLAYALDKKRECVGVSFDYGQKHRVELEAAKKIAAHYKIQHHCINIDNQALTSSSLVSDKDVLKNRDSSTILSSGIPSTYVPARNTIFLAYALGMAEHLGATEIYFGANALDHHGYPDCRPLFFSLFDQLMRVATKQAVEGNPVELLVPLILANKKEIISLAKSLGAPLELSMSCYDPVDNLHCGSCDACVLRRAGFKEAGVSDPTLYVK